MQLENALPCLKTFVSVALMLTQCFLQLLHSENHHVQVFRSKSPTSGVDGNETVLVL